MDIKLNHETLSFLSPVCALCSSQEDRTESVVPDTMPDIGSILDTNTTVYLRRKTAGMGKVFLEGEIHAIILYLGEDDSLQKLDLNMPCSCKLEADEVQEEDRMLATLTLIRGEGRMINPRKVSLLVETKACAEVYRPEKVELTSDAVGEDLEKRIEERIIPYIAAVESKSFVVTEEFALPPSAPRVREALSYDTKAVVTEQRSLGGKIILQGSVWLEFRYLGEEGELCQEGFSTPFSQLMDIPEGVEGSTEILLTPEINYVEILPGGAGVDTVHLELHLTAQMLYRGEKKLSLLSDAYSLHHICTTELQELTVWKPGSKSTIRGSEQVILELPEPAETSLFGYVKAGWPEKSEGKLRLPVQVHAFYRTQPGTVHSISKNVILELHGDKTDSSDLRMGIPDVADPYITLSGGNLEIRISAEVPVLPVEVIQIRFVNDLQLSELSPSLTENAPSLILVRPEGRSLWDLAKTYGSTVDRIEAVNPEEGAELLLVPVAR